MGFGDKLWRMSSSGALDISGIMKLIPHRYPMLLVDRILEVEPRVRAKGLKNVTMNEAFFQGHYPGQPIMPGVLILEAMAQTGAVIMLSDQSLQGMVPVIGAIDEVKFRRQVKPGDQLIMDLELLWFKKNVGRVKGVASVEGQMAAQMEMTFMVIPSED